MATEPFRDFSPEEREHFRAAKTGDVLPDGSVLLRRGDMNTMRLARLESWLESVIERGSTVAIYDDTVRGASVEVRED